MHILLTNDDGVFAPGLRALRKELLCLGDVTVVAPALEQSGVAHTITLLTPLVVKQVDDEDGSTLGWMIEGSPADSVKLAICELMPRPPDLIISGINAGSNAGINVLYSGTVASAILRAVERGQREAVFPFLLRATLFLNRLAPRLVGWAVERTGWRRPAPPAR